MTKNFKITLGAASTALVSLVPMATSFAFVTATLPTFTQVEAPKGGNEITSFNGILAILVTILGYVQALFWIAAVFTGLYAAFMYLTAGGEGEKISKANQMLIYTVVAVIVAVIAYSIPAFVKTTIQS